MQFEGRFATSISCIAESRSFFGGQDADEQCSSANGVALILDMRNAFALPLHFNFDSGTLQATYRLIQRAEEMMRAWVLLENLILMSSLACLCMVLQSTYVGFASAQGRS